MAAVIFLLASILCRQMLREVPGLGRSVDRAAVVVRSVQLVHQGHAQARPTRSGGAPASMRLIVLSTILPQPRGATSQHVSLARCRLDPDGSPCANPFRGGNDDYRPSSSWPQRLKLSTGTRSGSNADECDPIAIARLRLQPTLEQASVDR